MDLREKSSIEVTQDAEELRLTSPLSSKGLSAEPPLLAAVLWLTKLGKSGELAIRS